MSLKRAVEVGLARHPRLYLHVLRWLRRGGLEKRLYLSLLRAGDVTFDIGANRGYFTLLFSDIVGATGAVHAFEPVPPTFERLVASIRTRRRHPNVVLTCAACGEHPGTTSILVPAGDDGQASLRRQQHGSWRNARIVDEFPTMVIQLDLYVEERGIRNVAFVKCDIEGAELPALKGMAATLRRDRPMLLVESASWSHAFGYDTAGLTKFLASLGYDRFQPVGDGSNLLCGVYGTHGRRLQRVQAQ